MRKPEVIICPACGALRVNRTHRRCGRCGVKLFYPGDMICVEDVSDVSGYHWIGTKWIKVSELFASEFKKMKC